MTPEDINRSLLFSPRASHALLRAERHLCNVAAEWGEDDLMHAVIEAKKNERYAR
jgi:hypothetical protein